MDRGIVGAIGNGTECFHSMDERPFYLDSHIWRYWRTLILCRGRALGGRDLP